MVKNYQFPLCISSTTGLNIDDNNKMFLEH